MENLPTNCFSCRYFQVPERSGSGDFVFYHAICEVELKTIIICLENEILPTQIDPPAWCPYREQRHG